MRKLLALVLYLFIGLPAILGTLFLVPAKSWLLDREFYKQIVSGPETRAVLESPHLYEGFEDTIELGDRLTLSGPAAGTALHTSLPVPEILAAAGKTVDSAFDSLEGNFASGRIRIDMRDLKKSLEKGIPEFARVYSANVPVSPSLSASRLISLSARESALDLSVRPQDLSEADFNKVVRAATAAALSALPEVEEADLPPPSQTGPFYGKAIDPRDALDRGLIWMALLAGGIWVAGAFISADSANKRLKWLGATLLLPGIVVLAAGAVLRLGADPLVLNVARDPDLQRILTDPSLGAVRNWIHRPLWIISNGFLISGAAAMIVGGGVSASRRALRYRDFE